MSGKRTKHGEMIDVGDDLAAIELILKHYLDRTDIKGLMIIAELPGGAFEAKYTGTSNVAERLGRLELLKDMVLDDATEDLDPDEWLAKVTAKRAAKS